MSRPVRRASLLVSIGLFYAGPAMVGLLRIWYSPAGFDRPDWDAIQSATLISVFVWLFIIHIYETLYLIRQPSRDRLGLERLERLKTQAELSCCGA